jgi:hypothetical protein
VISFPWAVVECGFGDVDAVLVEGLFGVSGGGRNDLTDQVGLERSWAIAGMGVGEGG